jgi:predicted nucleic acid-binding Zn ribbon protein
LTVNQLAMEKNCPECGDKIIGRTDKKFCGDACRNAYNNRKNQDQNNLIRTINNRLRKNYRILSSLNPNDKTKTHKQKLLDLGFQFEYHTSIYTTQAGNVYYFIYDQGYLTLDNDWYALVKRK